MYNLNILINVICLNKIAHSIYNFRTKKMYTHTHTMCTIFHLQMYSYKQCRTNERTRKKRRSYAHVDTLFQCCFNFLLCSLWCFFLHAFVQNPTHLEFSANKRSAICLCLYLTFIATFVMVPSGHIRTFLFSFICMCFFCCSSPTSYVLYFSPNFLYSKWNNGVACITLTFGSTGLMNIEHF